MGKIGRNDPCPCGSGKKYKKCCLSFSPQEKEKIIQGYIKDVMALDKLSNSINSLIEKKDFQKAQAVCQQLLDDYPDQIDGISRFAQVYEAMGDNVKAAEYYRKSAEFATENDGFDQESVDMYCEDAERMEAG